MVGLSLSKHEKASKKGTGIKVVNLIEKEKVKWFLEGLGLNKW